MESEHTNSQDHRRKVDTERIKAATLEIIKAIGEDPDREGLAGTPDRVARFWKEFVEHDPGKCDVTFESVNTDQLVMVKNMRLWSLCEHHLLPFWVDVSVGYLAKERVLGLSKIARVAQKYAHRPQIQERLVHQIADDVSTLAQTQDVAVIAKGVHCCMVMRGVRTTGEMISSAMRGAFLQDPRARAELVALLKL